MFTIYFVLRFESETFKWKNLVGLNCHVNFYLLVRFIWKKLNTITILCSKLGWEVDFVTFLDLIYEKFLEIS